ncbi:hypothetical protein, partial [Thermosulfurimonas dismutans]|uniref:hypothetical protein n=1 Tax=Thermosulfurimonas dismutans TaxID=999894 RepID=UPI0012947C6B
MAFYLRRLLPNGMYYLPTETQKTPDFVVETALAPVVLEVGTAKRDVSQLKLKNMRYGIFLNFDLEVPEFKDKVVFSLLSERRGGPSGPGYVRAFSSWHFARGTQEIFRPPPAGL